MDFLCASAASVNGSARERQLTEGLRPGAEQLLIQQARTVTRRIGPDAPRALRPSATSHWPLVRLSEPPRARKPLMLPSSGGLVSIGHCGGSFG